MDAGPAATKETGTGSARKADEKGDGKVSEEIEAATAPATVAGELSFNEPLVA
jgi:hypothetical protein